MEAYAIMLPPQSTLFCKINDHNDDKSWKIILNAAAIDFGNDKSRTNGNKALNDLNINRPGSEEKQTEKDEKDSKRKAIEINISNCCARIQLYGQ